MLALGLAFVTLAAAYLLVAAPLIELYADRAVLIETRRALLTRLHTVAAELPALRSHAADIRAAGDSAKVTLDGATDPVALATLQGRIEEFASGAGVSIGSTESLPAEARGPYRRLGLRLVLSGSYDAIVTLVARLEAATPPLIVDGLQIHSFQRRPGAVAPGTTLDANVEVYGFRADAAPAEAKQSDSAGK